MFESVFVYLKRTLGMDHLQWNLPSRCEPGGLLATSPLVIWIEAACKLFVFIAENSELKEKGQSRGRKKRSLNHPPETMTEKTEGGGQERERPDTGGSRREPHQPPRSYSEFMRNLAAKYNTENSTE